MDIEIKEVVKDKLRIYPEKENDRLTFVWNIGDSQIIKVDKSSFGIHTNCVLFISEFYMEVELNFTAARIITFNKEFLSPISTMSSTGDLLALFYGIHSVNNIPKITLKQEDVPVFENIWANIVAERTNIKNPISEALLRNSLSRLLLMSQKIHMETEFDIPMDFKDLKKIREFQYLVNNNFKELTRVSDYAQIMKISAKKISEVFGCCYNKKASELIADRRNLYAKRQLKFTDELIKNIAYDLNFSDSQTFSHFFKKQNGTSPEDYRKKLNSTY